MGRAKTKGKEKKEKIPNDNLLSQLELLHPFRAVWSRIDCEQSLIFFSFSEGSAHARERRAAKPRVSRNVGGTWASRAFSKPAWSFACLARFARWTKKKERLLVV